MGFNTTILIHNDSFHVLQDNPKEFVDGIGEMINRSKEGSISVGNHGNPVYIMKTAHADIPRLYYTKSNGITELSHLNDEMLRRCEREEWFLKLMEGYVKDAQRNLTELKKKFKEIKNNKKNNDGKLNCE